MKTKHGFSIPNLRTYGNIHFSIIIRPVGLDTVSIRLIGVERITGVGYLHRASLLTAMLLSALNPSNRRPGDNLGGRVFGSNFFAIGKLLPRPVTAVDGLVQKPYSQGL